MTLAEALMAFSDKRTRRRLRSMDLLKIALVVITLSGMYLFLMVHDIENPYIKADVSLPRNFGAELQWNDSYFEGMGKTQKTPDHLENDDTFQDLFNFDSDRYAEAIKPTPKPIFQRKSKFRKRRSISSKSVRGSMTEIQLERRGNSDSRNGFVSQLDSQRQSSPIDFRRSSFNLREPSDYERQPETAIKSVNDHPTTSFRKELERSEEHSPNLQMKPKEKEQQSETAHLSNDEITQLEPLHLPQDEETPKKGQIPEPYLPDEETPKKGQIPEPYLPDEQTPKKGQILEPYLPDEETPKKGQIPEPYLPDEETPKKGQIPEPYLPDEETPKNGQIREPFLPESQTNIHQQEIGEIPSLSQTENSKTDKDLAIHEKDLDKLQENLNDRSVAENQTSDHKKKSGRKTTNDGNSKGSMSEPESLDVHQNNIALISSQKDGPNYEQDSSKVTDNKQHFDPLPKISSEKARSDSAQDSTKVASNQQRKPRPKITDNKQHSDPLPKISSEKARSDSEQDSSKVASNHQGKLPPEITNNEQHSHLHPKTSSEKRKSLLIFGDDRSGTTFVTKMFAADPQMFTVYEPLWVTKKWFSQLKIRDEKKIQFTRDVVNSLLSCRFTRSKAGKQFLSHTSSSWVGNGVFEKNVFRTSPFAKQTTSGGTIWPNLYQNPEFAEDVCLNKFNHSVVKVGQVRVPTESISVFIPDVLLANPDTDIRIIQIVRDPRGSINSRIKAGWISDFTFTGFPSLVYRMCANIEANIQFARKVQGAWIKERYMEINYQEITSMPITTAKKIYKFAGFQMPDSLVDWIVQSTNPDERQLQLALNNPFSHVRDARKNYLKWRSESPIKRVRIIEQRCKSLLDLLGLDAVADEMETLCS